MNEKLIVKDFGPIKNAELDLKKVTVFIGPQGSGKSTLAKLVAICKEDEKPLLTPKETSIAFRVMDYGIESYKNKNTTFHYESKISNIGYGKMYHKSATPLGGNLEFEVIKISERLKLMDTVGEELRGGSLLETYGKYQELLKENAITEPIYIPTERFLISTISNSLFGLMSNNINLPKTLTEFGNKYAKASTQDAKEDHRFIRKESYVSGMKKSKYIELFDLHFQHKDGQDFLIDTKNNYMVNLRESASGMQSSIPLILVVRHEYSKGNTHFIVEEPELNLFPTTQKELIGYLADKCTQNGNELLMTTHSPYVLTALNNLIFAFQVAQVLPERADEIAQIIPREQWLNPDDVAAYYVGEDENGEKGGVHSIFNRKTGLIGQNELDEVSDELGDEFSALMNIYRTRKRETVN
jgi:predicted ATPase